MIEPRFHLESFTLERPSGDALCGDLRFPPNLRDPKPVIIVCHSFMAFKDWGFFPTIGEKFAEAEFATVVFNFSGNGVVDGENRITDTSKFESNTFSRERADLEAVIDAVDRRKVGANVIDRNRIILLGHSRGGGISIIQTARDSRVRSLITWSAVSSFDRWTLHQKERWRRLGYLPLAKDTTVSPLRLGTGLLDDFEAHRDELNITGAASRIDVPWLILHGAADVTVHSREAEALYAASRNRKATLMLIDKVGHLYNARSPQEDNYQTLGRVIGLTINWLRQHLS